MSKILKVKARQVFDSRGNPTVEAEVYTKNILRTPFTVMCILVRIFSFFQDSEETIHSAEINDTSYEPPSCFSLGKNSKWLTQKKCIFQNHQFLIFFCENFMDWSLG